MLSSVVRSSFRKIVGRLRHDPMRGRARPVALGFVATERGASRPDVQIGLVPAAPTSLALRCMTPGLTLAVRLLRPGGGAVLARAEPAPGPGDQPQPLASQDRHVLVAGMKIARSMVDVTQLRATSSASTSPITCPRATRMAAHLERGAMGSHPAGTCRMGNECGRRSGRAAACAASIACGGRRSSCRRRLRQRAPTIMIG
jgi:choline dehydrogenase-like flavoprotein